jgi:hypothetical protein
LLLPHGICERVSKRPARNVKRDVGRRRGPRTACS